MRSDFFLPPRLSSLSSSRLEELIFQALSVCRDDRLRRLVKTRDIQRGDGDQGQFSCRLEDHAGLFALLREAEARPQETRVHFSLHFFPDAEAERCESLRLNAAILAQRAEYPKAIRHFSLYPALIGTASDRDAARPFFIGNITLTLLPDASGMEFSLVAPQKRRIRNPHGVALPASPAEREPQWLIAPGDWEEDAEAFNLAKRWFDAVAVALSEAAGALPSFFRYGEWPCADAEWSDDGSLNSLPPSDNREARLSLIWGRKFPEEKAHELEECGLLRTLPQRPLAEMPEKFRKSPYFPSGTAGA